MSLARDSWTAPLDVQRGPPGQDANTVAAAQIKEVLRRRPADGRVPLFLFDAGYDPIHLALDLGALELDTPVACAVRLRKARTAASTPIRNRRRPPAAAGRGGTGPSSPLLRGPVHVARADRRVYDGGPAVRPGAGAGAGLGRLACHPPEPRG